MRGKKAALARSNPFHDLLRFWLHKEVPQFRLRKQIVIHGAAFEKKIRLRDKIDFRKAAFLAMNRQGV
jgi:hypothetical protein